MTHPKLTLEKLIEAETKSYDGKMAVWADDLRGNTLEILPDEPYETASCIKAYILTWLFHCVELGSASLDDELEYKPEHCVEGSGVFRDLAFGSKMPVRNVATLMIIISDNIATNMLIDYLGQENINNGIHAMGFTATTLHNPIHFDRYEKLGTTTPRDYGTLFTRLARNELLCPESNAAMLDIYRRQHYNSMLTRCLPPYFLDSEDTGDEELFYVASKSGSMDACRNDGGIIHTPYGDYVLVIMHKDFSDSIYYNDHPAYLYGSRVSRMLFDRYLALEGRISL